MSLVITFAVFTIYYPQSFKIISEIPSSNQQNFLFKSKLIHKYLITFYER